MIYGAIGGMQLKNWMGYFKIITPTMKVLRSAKNAPGCVNAATYKSGDVYFAVSFWNTKEQMQEFARSGLHGKLTDVAMEHLALFYNHSQEFESLPSRKDQVAAWKSAMVERNGKGTVGSYPI